MNTSILLVALLGSGSPVVSVPSTVVPSYAGSTSVSSAAVSSAPVVVAVTYVPVYSYGRRGARSIAYYTPVYQTQTSSPPTSPSPTETVVVSSAPVSGGVSYSAPPTYSSGSYSAPVYGGYSTPVRAVNC